MMGKFNIARSFISDLGQTVNFTKDTVAFHRSTVPNYYKNEFYPGVVRSMQNGEHQNFPDFHTFVNHKMAQGADRVANGLISNFVNRVAAKDGWDSTLLDKVASSQTIQDSASKAAGTSFVTRFKAPLYEGLARDGLLPEGVHLPQNDHSSGLTSSKVGLDGLSTAAKVGLVAAGGAAAGGLGYALGHSDVHDASMRDPDHPQDSVHLS